MNIALSASVLQGLQGFFCRCFTAVFLGMAPAETLALSFAAFLISGVLGSVNYYKK